MSSDGVESDDTQSCDSVSVVEIIDMDVEALPMIVYECKRDDGVIESIDRSDLMDGGTHQRLVMAYERVHPPPWDTECTHCQAEGCEECICDECERPCRHIKGINYGCVIHPVI